MRLVLVDASSSVLEERRRLGIDKRDEVWEGVPHLVPPAGAPHQRLSADFFVAVVPLARSRGLEPFMETGLFRTADDYRVPDQLFCREELLTERGAEGADLVVEVRSPRDETYDKLEFYARLGVSEAIVLHPRPRRAELFRAVGGRMLPVQSAPDGSLYSDVLGIRLSVADDVLRISWDGGSAEL